MKIMVWNVRGLIRVKEHKMQEIIDRWFTGWRCFQNYSHALNERIWVLWSDDFQVSLIDITDQSITTSIKLDDHSFFFSAIYGCNEDMDRRRLWSHLYSNKSIILDEPWFLIREFNFTVHPSESFNFFESQLINSDMKEFIEAKNRIPVFDHVTFGPLFTWINKHLDGFIARKLDKVLVNSSCHSRYAQSHVKFLAPNLSNHYPAYILLQ